jgi:low affinity Fe/Cu permease
MSSTKRAPLLERFSAQVSHRAGSSAAFAIAVAVVVGWAVTGPLFKYSTNWQLVINTGTTIVTFLMVFLIQRAQNKDAKAIQLKLNELVCAMAGASNRLIDVEDLDENELEMLHQYYRRLVEMSAEEQKLTRSHTIEEAEALHERKRDHRAAVSKR